MLFGSGKLLGAAVVAAVTLGSCGGGPTPKTVDNADAALAPSVCQRDQTREFFCDGLLSGQGAPAPYENCPAGIELPAGGYPAKGSVARFDARYTEWARQRAKPGHACCYSWCADVRVADPADVLPYAGCTGPEVISDAYCMAELEAGTSAPAPDPLQRCPIAIQPPEAVSFAVPRAVPLDTAATQARRQQNDPACCYNWCSPKPPGM